jgi:hypothetical protein
LRKLLKQDLAYVGTMLDCPRDKKEAHVAETRMKNAEVVRNST